MKFNYWLFYWMPYQFVPLDEKGRLFLALNRNYKPLGYTKQDWVEYNDYRHLAVKFRRNPRLLKGIWSNPERLYLYRGYIRDPIEWDDYCKRLKKLGETMKLIS